MFSSVSNQILQTNRLIVVDSKLHFNTTGEGERESGLVFTSNYLQLEAGNGAFVSVNSVGSFGCPFSVRLFFVLRLRFIVVFGLLSPFTPVQVFALVSLPLCARKSFALFPIEHVSVLCWDAVVFDVLSSLNVLMPVAGFGCCSGCCCCCCCCCAIFNELSFVGRCVVPIGGKTRFSSCK